MEPKSLFRLFNRVWRIQATEKYTTGEQDQYLDDKLGSQESEQPQK
jgi:hypothetical protein